MTATLRVALALLSAFGHAQVDHVTEAPATSYVAVSVATVWARPDSPRAIDRPALGNPAAVRAWTRSLDTTERRGLVGRIETQALFGERVRVLERRGRWARVVVTDQPTPRDRRGYPGWVPSAQLVASRRFGNLLSGRVAIVERPTAWLRVRSRRIELSYGTRLPVLGVAGPEVLVATPGGAVGRIARVATAVYPSRARIPGPTGAAIVTAARSFLGVRYLWGGTSAFGFDCSGLIELAYRAHGIVIPRDADAQAVRGTPVARSRVRPGDLLFYGRAHVHHATLYVGGSRMIEAPNSAASVRLAPVRSADYARARRYLR